MDEYDFDTSDDDYSPSPPHSIWSPPNSPLTDEVSESSNDEEAAAAAVDPLAIALVPMMMAAEYEVDNLVNLRSLFTEELFGNEEDSVDGGIGTPNANPDPAPAMDTEFQRKRTSLGQGQGEKLS